MPIDNPPGARTTVESTYWLAIADKADKTRQGLRAVKGQLVPFRLVPHRVTAATPDALPWVAASGFAGIEELQLATFAENPKVKGPAPTKQRFVVRMTFCEPDPTVKPGERVFTVGDAAPLAKIDPVVAGGGARCAFVKEVEASCAADGLLTIRFATQPGGNPAVISGVELIRK